MLAWNPLRWPIYIIKLVDNTKLPCYTLSPMRIMVSLKKLTPFIFIMHKGVKLYIRIVSLEKE